MAEQEEKSAPIPWLPLITLIGAGSGFLLLFPQLTSSRPGGGDSRLAGNTFDHQTIDARLWQDPLGVAISDREKNEKRGEEAKQKNSAAHSVVEFQKLLIKKCFADSANYPLVRSIIYPLDDELRLEDQASQVQVLAVMIPGGPYVEDVERRLRSRRAVIEALGVADYNPEKDQQPPAAEPPPQPPAEPEPTPVDDVELPDDLDSGADLTSVTDSHLSWTVTLRLAHTITGVARRCPNRVAKELETAGLVGAKLRLRLTHDGYGLDPQDADQAVAVTRVGSRARLTGVEWPLEYFPGIALTFTWQRGAVVLRARSTLLEAPVTIDSTEYEHRYDPAVLTRDTAPGCARRGDSDHGPLTLGQRVLRAVRRTGHLDPTASPCCAATCLPTWCMAATPARQAPPRSSRSSM